MLGFGIGVGNGVLFFGEQHLLSFSVAVTSLTAGVGAVVPTGAGPKYARAATTEGKHFFSHAGCLPLPARIVECSTL